MTVQPPPTPPRDDDDLEAALRVMLARRAEDVTPRFGGGEPDAPPPLASVRTGHRPRRRRPPHRTMFAVLATAAAAALVVGAVTLLTRAGDHADMATGADERPDVVWPLGDQAVGAADVVAAQDAVEGSDVTVQASTVANAYMREVVGSPDVERRALSYGGDQRNDATASYDLNGLSTLVRLRFLGGEWYVTSATTSAVAITAIEPSPDGVAVTVALPDPAAVAYARLDLIGAAGDPIATTVLSRNIGADERSYNQIPGTIVLPAPAGSVPVVAQIVTYGLPADTPGAVGSGVPIAVTSARIPGAAAASASPPGAPVSTGDGTPLPAGVDAHTASEIVAASELYRGDPTWTDWRAAVDAWLKIGYDPARWTGPADLAVTDESPDGLAITGRYAATDGGTGEFRLARLSPEGPWFLLDLQDDTLRVDEVRRVPGGLHVTVESDDGGFTGFAPYDKAGIARLRYVDLGPADRVVRLLRAWLPDDNRSDGPRRPPWALPGPITA
jgi:hypothetical protein